jgi:thiamine-phosphate pyrophosphorylase
MTTDLESLWLAARKLKVRGCGEKALPPLLFFTDPLRTPDPERALARLPRGAAIIYRAFGAVDAIPVGRRLAILSRRRGVLFFVGASIPLAIALHADGLHLPQRLARRAGDIRRLSRRFMITAAAHDFPAALRARRSGVDAVVVSAVFPSESPSAGKPIGPRRFATIVRRLDLAVYGLGGIDARTIRRLGLTGAAGVAAVGGVANPN